MSIQERVKKIGRNLVKLNQTGQPQVPAGRVLIVDNGYASYRHLELAIERTLQYADRGSVSIITFEHRKGFISGRFGQIDIITPAVPSAGRYEIASLMLRYRRMGFRQIIILSLDVTPILASLLFTKSSLFLYNRWEQWWELKRLGVNDGIAFMARSVINLFIFAYLILVFLLIRAKMAFNIIRFKGKGGIDDGVFA
ncbi:MAG: hypothetical protein PHR44_01830 [Candidatus Omnitrophica bacterium]|nr:hypothetical protein [Candidatus Omnitrophota bacterium]